MIFATFWEDSLLGSLKNERKKLCTIYESQFEENNNYTSDQKSQLLPCPLHRLLSIWELYLFFLIRLHILCIIFFSEVFQCFFPRVNYRVSRISSMTRFSNLNTSSSGGSKSVWSRPGWEIPIQNQSEQDQSGFSLAKISLDTNQSG